MSAYTGINNINSKHFEALFFYAPTGILITDQQGKIVAINPFALKEFGYTEKELVGQKVEILIPSRYQKNHSHHHKKYISKSPPHLMNAGLDLSAVKKDGTEFPVEITLSTYEKTEEKYAIAFITNTSLRKAAQSQIAALNAELQAKVMQRTEDLHITLRQLETSRDELEDAQAFQKALFDNAGAMIIATDEKGIIKFYNPEAARSIGYTEAEVVNKHTPVLFHDATEISKKREELAKKFGTAPLDDFGVLVEKSKRHIHTEEQYTYKRKNNTGFPVLLAITAIRNSGSQITGFIGVAIDITARKKAEENLLETLRREKELSELKSRFVSMASHEFRTPLSTVLSSAYLAEKYMTTEDQFKREKHLQRIVTAVSTLTDILNDFLSVGKIEEGKITVKPVQLVLHDFLTTIISDLKGILKPKQKITYLHKGNDMLITDASLLKHIIINLVSNASKFSPEGSPIEIKTTNPGKHFTLSVKDKGIGISPADQKHLMERFFRGTNAVNIQGTGLGLHIISKYAELLNGEVKCKSELGKGSCFTVKIITKNGFYEKDTADRR